MLACKIVARIFGKEPVIYQKKYAETRNHQHKRALALTSRKFIRLLFGLLDKGQLYSPEKGR